MIAITENTYPAFPLRRAFRNRQFKFIFTVLALVFPDIAFENIEAGTERRPGRSFYNIGAPAFLA